MNWGLIVTKQEMTRIWQDTKMIPVTLVIMPEQVVVRYKTMENDGYTAVVVGVPSKKWGYSLLKEFHCNESTIQSYPVGSSFSDLLIDGTAYNLVGTSKGKGFQWVIKRHHFAGGPETHGSKFHRAGWSTGNRKPRRTHKNHPMAWHMGSDKVTLKWVKLVARYSHEGKNVFAFAGSLPGAYNTQLFVSL
jgi:large subunit ribosomal protein L3